MFKSFKKLLHKAHNVLLLSHLGMVVAESLESGVWGFSFWASLIVNGLLLVDWEGIHRRLDSMECRIENKFKGLNFPVSD